MRATSFFVATCLLFPSDGLVSGAKPFFDPTLCGDVQCEDDAKSATVPKLPLVLPRQRGCVDLKGIFAVEVYTSPVERGGDAGYLFNALDSCCDLYEQCKHVCGTSLEYCTSKFTECGERGCNEVGEKDKKVTCRNALKRAMDLYAFDSCESFTVVQKNSCECTPKSTLKRRRFDVIVDFLSQRGLSEPHNKASMVMSDIDRQDLDWLDTLMDLFHATVDPDARGRPSKVPLEPISKDSVTSIRPLRELMKSMIAQQEMKGEILDMLEMIGVRKDEL